MRLIPVLFVFSLLFFSCHHDEGDFVIINASDFDIDSLSIVPDFKNQQLSLNKNQQKKLTTNMNRVSSDGSYRIIYKNKKNDNFEDISFGYYTNGSQIEKRILVTITNDTIIAKSEFYLNYKN